MLQLVLASRLHTAPRLSGTEPQFAALGLGVLGAAWVLPILWQRGINPLPPCLFHTITGQPCPMCGGTRCFVAIAHGDLGAAIHVYPIGPLLFVAMLVGLAYSLWAVVTGRRVDLRLRPRLHTRLLIAGASVLALNWAAKLFLLGY